MAKNSEVAEEQAKRFADAISSKRSQLQSASQTKAARTVARVRVVHFGDPDSSDPLSFDQPELLLRSIF